MRLFSKITTVVVLIFGLLFSIEYIDIKALAAPKGSTIGNVAVEELSKKEMKQQLNTAIANWLDAEIYITVGEDEISLTGEDFIFDINTSIKQYGIHTERPWYAFFREKRIIQEPLIVEANSTLIEKIENQTNAKDEDLTARVLEAASYLKKSPIKIDIKDLSIEDEDVERIAFEKIALNDSQMAGAKDIAARLNGYIIEPEIELSFNDLAINATNNQDVMSLVASGLHSAVLQSSFEISERHQASEVPTHVKPGYEAIVNPILKKDFRFISHSKVPAKIVATVKLEKLKIELYSLPGNPKVSVFEKDNRSVKPRTIYRYSSYLEEGERGTAQQSKSGLQLLIYRTITNDDGDEKAELISQNYYAPKNEVIELSSKQTTIDIDSTSLEEAPEECDTNDASYMCNSTNDKRKKATKSKNGSPLPEGSYYTETGDIVIPGNTK
ncbi:VanW family protein [Viridibacillus sp. YIM B01967]|uniref:VanW family protein n=1 Tax=Viridibacillus soli TaxID=2798301 RepID=A0ABS1H214_9BACL|nr:VanW family protein [Viridibacillus soli]MBK3493447.1 VanW family protein [Viridibacillus soli]